MSRPRAFLIIESGEPFEADHMISIDRDEVLLGRAWQAHRPDVSFTNPYISKLHASIQREGSVYTITDLNSKHGTTVNGTAIPALQPLPLRYGDRIGLARGAAELRFHLADFENDHTVDFSRPLISPVPNTSDPLTVDPVRREARLNGDPLPLLGKDMDLMLLLYHHRNQAVSYDEIRRQVWPERPFDEAAGVPDVGVEEITALVYRLRKRLGAHSTRIASVPRFGYRLDLNNKS
ncbi:MAG: FHA domain-containing protein [Solirubrobacterales bacterium]